MKFSRSSFVVVELAFLAGYPALSVIFAVPGSEGLWNPWIIVATSFVLFYTGLVLYNPIQRCLPQDRSQSIIFLFLFFLCSARRPTQLFREEEIGSMPL